jgi:hypothetical protein
VIRGAAVRVDVCGARTVVEARRVVKCSGVRRRTCGGAGRIPLPRRRARDNATDDGADARQLLMALPIPELVAASTALVARAARAAAAAVVTTRSADAACTTAARATGRVAVDVVAGRAATEPGVVGLPPTRGHGPRRTRVLATVHGATHRRPTRTAVGRGSAQRGVGRPRAQQVSPGRHCQRRTNDGRLREEAATGHPASEAGGDAVDELLAQASSRSLARTLARTLARALVGAEHRHADTTSCSSISFTLRMIIGSDARLPATT